MSLIFEELDLKYFKGYSYLSNQYGLSVDNIAGYELVLPNGTVMDVTSENTDLWFGLRVSKRSSFL